MNDTEQRIADLEKTIADLTEAQKKYAAALIMYDVTVACLEPFVAYMGDSLMGQVKAARDAYQEVTGVEPLSLKTKCDVV